MKFLVLLVVAVSAVAAADKKYVFDYMKPALSSAEVIALISSREGPQWPTLNAVPDDAARFDCSSKKQPGFYADVGTQCQVFHRCDINGNLTSYLCVNTTVFNQLTLVCDYWFNVDCDKSVDVENLANSRLYTDQPLFDSPPADYVAPMQTGTRSDSGAGPSSAQARPAKGGKATTTKKPAGGAGGKTTPKKGPVKVGGSASISVSAGGRSDEGDVKADANANEAGSNVTDQQPDKATTVAADAGASTSEAGAADANASSTQSSDASGSSTAASADATNQDSSSAASADQSTPAA